MMQIFMRRVRWLFAIAFVFASMLAMPLAFAQADAKPGDDFIKLIDAKQYAESWDVASDYFKRSVSRGEWAAQVKEARGTLGSVVTRNLKKSEPQKNPPGAPAGDYLLLTFETKFSNSDPARTETLALIKGADDRWRAVGYFIR